MGHTSDTMYAGAEQTEEEKKWSKRWLRHSEVAFLHCPGVSECWATIYFSNIFTANTWQLITRLKLLFATCNCFINPTIALNSTTVQVYYSHVSWHHQFLKIAFNCQHTDPLSLSKKCQKSSRTAIAALLALLPACCVTGCNSLVLSGSSGMYCDALVGLRSR